MSTAHKDDVKEVPDIVDDNSTGTRYLKGKFLGKGGFARCYELINERTKQIVAGKIVSKSMLARKNQREKMTQEIAIHRSLSNFNVVGFLGYFEDVDHVFVVLELCPRRSLMELHKRRRAVTEPEARYFTKQLVEGTRYLHNERVIHRDLKLGNLFLNEDLAVKIGDFGLATKLDYDGERKKTLCGTPNYIAPEMLNKKGHSYEVDIWAVGCILYTLLVGKPPFETTSLKDTYSKIRRNEYHIPSKISQPAHTLIRRLLAAEPSQRPTIHEILTFDFFNGYLPPRLPTSCLSIAPQFKFTTASNSQLPPLSQQQQQVLTDVNRVKPGQFRFPTNLVVQFAVAAGVLSPKDQARRDILHAPLRALGSVPEHDAFKPMPGVPQGQQQQQPSLRVQPGGAAYEQQQSNNNMQVQPSAGCPDIDVPLELPQRPDAEMPSDFWMTNMLQMLTEVMHTSVEKLEQPDEDEALDPASMPVFWVSKWVDYSDKYGLGYQLCDNSVGVLFNDMTKIVLDGQGIQVQYIERDNRESYYTISAYPHELTKKVTLLKYFRTYMNEHLLKAGANIPARDGDELVRLPCLRTWFRTRSAIVLHLNNGTLQINFFNDHTKCIICPLMRAVTYIDANREFKTFQLDKIKEFGASKEIITRLRYARTMVERLLSQPSSSRPNSLSTGGPNAPKHGSNINMASMGSGASLSNVMSQPQMSPATSRQPPFGGPLPTSASTNRLQLPLVSTGVRVSSAQGAGLPIPPGHNVYHQQRFHSADPPRRGADL